MPALSEKEYRKRKAKLQMALFTGELSKATFDKQMKQLEKERRG